MPTKFKIHGQKSSFQSDNRHKLYDYRRTRDSELGPIKIFRGSGRWQKIQKVQIAQHPTCFDPFKTHSDGLALARTVHHIIGLLECLRLGQLERLGCVPANLRSLCFHCHNRVEGIFDRQGPEVAKRLFITEDEERSILQLVEIPNLT